MIWAIIEPFVGWIAAGIAALGAFLVAQAKARRDGRRQERQKQKEADREEADRVLGRVRDARRVRPDDRFRD